MARHFGIIAYGEQEDRAKLKAVTDAEGTTGSAWIIKQIRDRYEELFGKDDPHA
jgi:hypothetical protein